MHLGQGYIRRAYKLTISILRDNSSNQNKQGNTLCLIFSVLK